MTRKKENGSYYTPDIIADFIVKRVFDKRHYTLPDKLQVLEPSVGDGVFVKALLDSKSTKGREITLELIERESEELKKAISVANNFKTKSVKLTSHLGDYLEFEKSSNKKYDLIVGNPPYIKKNHLSKRQLELCEKIHKKVNLSNKKIKNIWTAFLIGAVESLNESGIICFVLPAELLQVSYAKELRDHLRKVLNKIEIFAFNELVFEGVEQDVIIVIGSKSSKQKGVSFFQANKLVDLKKPELIPGNTNIDRDTLDKWTNYILSEEELFFLDTFKRDLKAVKDYSNVQVGIVTAVNDFFIIKKSEAIRLKLTPYCKPILQKSSFMPAALTVNPSDFESLKNKDKPVFVLSFPDRSEVSLPKVVRDYLKFGERKGINKGYKCELRNNWFHVPSIWFSEGVFIKRSNLLPRIMVNQAKLNVTDAFYRISMKNDYEIDCLAFSFFNTLSLIFTELEGRFYGGGVLELIPSEFKNIPVPYFKVKQKDFERLDKMLRSKESVNNILNYTDNLILRDNLKLSKHKITKIKGIYKKLVNRRLKVDIKL